jgi:hypothetical protein
MLTRILRPFARIAFAAAAALVVVRVVGGAFNTERGAWLAWLSPVAHTQAGIRAEEADIFLWDGGALVNVTHHFGGDVAPTWSRDGRMAWLSNRDGDYDVYVRDGLQMRNISQNERADFEPLWSPDGRLAWVGRDSARGEAVYVWDGVGVTVAGRAAAIQNGSLHWSADGRLRWVGLNGMSGAISVWDGEVIATTPLDVTTLVSLSWSPGGKLAWISRNAHDERSLYMLDTTDSSRPVLLHRGTWISDRVVWSSDERLAWGEWVSAEQFNIVIWADGQRTRLPTSGFIYSLAWSGTGQLVWVDAARAPIGVLRVWDGRETFVIDDDVRQLSQPTWSRAGRLAWSTARTQGWTVYVWDGQEAQRVSPPTQDALAPSWVGG